ncbi:MAG: heat-inducible transcriptional repressor HrcA, partial [Acetivibrio sp.]
LNYIIQPHTSAGRIPTDKGYRLYVDNMMSEKVQEIENIREELDKKADKIEILLQHVAKLLAVNTNYTSMVSKPKYKHKKVKFVQLSEVDDTQLLAVIVIEGNIVKNKIINLKLPMDKDMVLKLNILLNTFLQGLDLTEINMSLIQKMKEQAGEYSRLVGKILDVIAEAVGEEENLEIYTSGATNILRYPELSDAQKASELLYTFEEKDELTKLINNTNFGEEMQDRGIQVYIGDESPLQVMKDCSVVTATYEIEEGVYGKIGIVGPKRMDYEKVVGTLQTLMVQLDDIFKNKT